MLLYLISLAYTLLVVLVMRTKYRSNRKQLINLDSAIVGAEQNLLCFQKESASILIQQIRTLEQL